MALHMHNLLMVRRVAAAEAFWFPFSTAPDRAGIVTDLRATSGRLWLAADFWDLTMKGFLLILCHGLP